ncbi:MAG: MlaD family protein [Bacteroidales bacterium]|nr:MlaD family protein [Bacteroidales bacterium]
MKINLNREQKIGLFTILIAASLYITINYLKGKDIFGTTHIYYTVYDSVDGLNSTGPVYIKGYKVGTVQEIEYQEKSEDFLVTMKIDSKYSISDSSVAQLYSSDLLGGKSIRIQIAKGGRLIVDRDTLRSGIEPGLIENISAQILPLKDQASELISNLNTTFVNVNEVLDPEAKRHLAQSIQNLDRTLQNIRNITSNLDKNGPEITSLISNLDNLSSSLKQSVVVLDKGLGNITEITDSLKSADLAGTVKSLRDLLLEINNPQGSIGKLIKTDSLHNSIDVLVRDIDVLVKNIQDNPKKYIKISVF